MACQRIDELMIEMSAPKRNTPYFSASEQEGEVRERSPKRLLDVQAESMSSGRVVEEQSQFCEHPGPVVGYIRRRFGDSSIAMDLAALTRNQIWKICRMQ